MSRNQDGPGSTPAHRADGRASIRPRARHTASSGEVPPSLRRSTASSAGAAWTGALAVAMFALAPMSHASAVTAPFAGDGGGVPPAGAVVEPCEAVDPDAVDSAGAYPVPDDACADEQDGGANAGGGNAGGGNAGNGNAGNGNDTEPGLGVLDPALLDSVPEQSALVVDALVSFDVIAAPAVPSLDPVALDPSGVVNSAPLSLGGPMATSTVAGVSPATATLGTPEAAPAAAAPAPAAPATESNDPDLGPSTTNPEVPDPNGVFGAAPAPGPVGGWQGYQGVSIEGVIEGVGARGYLGIDGWGLTGIYGLGVGGNLTVSAEAGRPAPGVTLESRIDVQVGPVRGNFRDEADLFGNVNVLSATANVAGTGRVGVAVNPQTGEMTPGIGASPSLGLALQARTGIAGTIGGSWSEDAAPQGVPESSPSFVGPHQQSATLTNQSELNDATTCYDLGLNRAATPEAAPALNLDVDITSINPTTTTETPTETTTTPDTVDAPDPNNGPIGMTNTGMDADPDGPNSPAAETSTDTTSTDSTSTDSTSTDSTSTDSTSTDSASTDSDSADSDSAGADSAGSSDAGSGGSDAGSGGSDGGAGGSDGGAGGSDGGAGGSDGGGW